MSVKEDVLEALEKNKGRHISGSELAAHLNVSRNSIWKAIKQLEKQGHLIEAVTNKGYCLLTSNDIVSKQSIEKYLGDKKINIEVFDTVTSTNNILREKADAGEPEWSVVVAREQTKGRGRMGRSFYSPSDTGIYMSVLLRPSLPIDKSVYVTTCAAVAVAKSLDKNAGINTQIKWVNDIFYKDRKISGILTEGTTDIESGSLKYVVLGIGINIFPPKEEFPDEIKDVASSVFEKHEKTEDYRSKIIADILNYIYETYNKIADKPYFNDYKEKSMLLNQPIYIIRKNEKEEAIAIDLDDDFGLIVRKNDGTTESLFSGEVSIRKRNQ